MNVAVRRPDREDRLEGDDEPMTQNLKLKAAIRRSANLRPVKLVAIGLVAAQRPVWRTQPVVPVVCHGLNRKDHDRQSNQRPHLHQCGSIWRWNDAVCITSTKLVHDLPT